MCVTCVDGWNGMCELGRSAPNPVLSTLRYFRDESVAHVEQEKCVAGVCPALTEFVIQEDACIGCQFCMRHCPADAISGEKKQPHVIDVDKCVSCGVCRDVCPEDAVKAEQKENDGSYNRRN
jgi:NADH-quinone oxidoreductase subunit F